MNTTLLVLTLNEIDGVQVILPQIDQSRFERVLVVDGGSTDGTIEWCRDNGYEVHVQNQPGIRWAYLETLPKIQSDVILTFSPDGNCAVAAIDPILERMQEGYDLVIGSRYLGDARSEDDDMVTAFGNWLFTRTINWLYRARYTDAMVIFRAFRRSLVYELGLHEDDAFRVPERLFRTVIGWDPLMSVRAAKRNKRVSEVAAGEPARIGGERKLQVFRWGGALYLQIWRELWHWR